MEHEKIDWGHWPFGVSKFRSHWDVYIVSQWPTTWTLPLFIHSQTLSRAFMYFTISCPHLPPKLP